MPNPQQYSPGMIGGVNSKAARLLKDLFDRINYLTGEVERLNGMGPGGPGGGGPGSNVTGPALLSVGPDNLVSPGAVPGGVVGGTEGWGAITIQPVTGNLSLTIDQGTNRTLRFGGTAGGTLTVALPAISGKMWMISNATNSNLTFTSPFGPATVTVAANRSAIIVNLAGGGGIFRITADAL